MNEYINIIYLNCQKHLTFKTPLLKFDKNNVIVPALFKYENLTQYNYSLSQLHQIAKTYKLKVCGNKKELIIRIFGFLRLSTFAIKIQKIFRGKLQRLYNILHGPAYLKREQCTNDTDFFTIEKLSNLDYFHFYSYKDYDNFIYGFDVLSFYNLITKSGKSIKNPYNRNTIPEIEINNFKLLIQISKALKLNINLQIENNVNDLSAKKLLELKALELFQTINYLGNYSNPEWFLTLSHLNLIKFMRELIDIWKYRAGLSNEIKSQIYPPDGDIFRHFIVNSLFVDQDLDIIKNNILNLLEKFVNFGIDNDSKALGAYYILGALTLVNENAANALPWLFQSFSYY